MVENPRRPIVHWHVLKVSSMLHMLQKYKHLANPARSAEDKSGASWLIDSEI